MKWLFGRRDRFQEMPAPVRKALEREFHLQPETINKLRYVEKSGTFAGRPVRLLRIYDPTQVSPAGKTIAKYADLVSQNKALLFEGHLEKLSKTNIFVSVQDCRPK